MTYPSYLAIPTSPLRDLAKSVAQFKTQQCVEELEHLGVYNIRTTFVLAEYSSNVTESSVTNIPTPKESPHSSHDTICNHHSSSGLQRTGQVKSRLGTVPRNRRRRVLFQRPKRSYRLQPLFTEFAKKIIHKFFFY